jgi:ribosomal protein L22
MSTTMVRVSRRAREILREICEKTGEPAREILGRAIEEYRRKCFLAEANRAYADLRKDKKAWKAELDERKTWDTTLGDGEKGR